MSPKPSILYVCDLVVRFLSSGDQKTGELGRGLTQRIFSRLQKWQSENINENTSADFLSRSPLSNDPEAEKNYLFDVGKRCQTHLAYGSLFLCFL